MEVQIMEEELFWAGSTFAGFIIGAVAGWKAYKIELARNLRILSGKSEDMADVLDEGGDVLSVMAEFIEGKKSYGDLKKECDEFKKEIKDFTSAS